MDGGVPVAAGAGNRPHDDPERRSSTSRDGAVLIGRAAIEAYVDGDDGRLMRTLKSVLGTELIDETTLARPHRIGFRDVIGDSWSR